MFSSWKDRGNCIFKEGNHPLALSYYKQAIKFLCLLDIPSTVEQQSCAISLIFSLLLNLAACQLKLSHFNEACFYCNLVLNCDPCNVKARYRRGLAFKNLNLLNDALEDFEAALKLEPNNKDISRELHSLVDCFAHSLTGKRVNYQFDPLGTDRKGKKPVISMANESVLLNEAAEASCSFVVPVNNASTDLGSEINVSDGVMDLGNTSSVSNEVCLDVDMNVDSSSCPNHNKGNYLLKFNKKGGGHSRLRIDASSYNCLLQGKEIHVHQKKNLSTMKIRVYTLPQKNTQMGTPHEELSREAAVPPSNALFEMPNDISSFESSENVELVDEEVIVQIDKKKRVTLDSSTVSKISLDQFHFAAVRKQSNKICSHKMDRFQGRGQLVRDAGKLRSKSLVFERLSFGCRYSKVKSADKKTKRNDANLFQLDDHYHPPFKKRRLCPSMPSFSSISQVRWISSSFGGFSTPLFIW